MTAVAVNSSTRGFLPTWVNPCGMELCWPALMSLRCQAVFALRFVRQSSRPPLRSFALKNNVPSTSVSHSSCALRGPASMFLTVTVFGRIISSERFELILDNYLEKRHHPDWSLTDDNRVTELDGPEPSAAERPWTHRSPTFAAG